MRVYLKRFIITKIYSIQYQKVKLVQSSPWQNNFFQNVKNFTNKIFKTIQDSGVSEMESKFSTKWRSIDRYWTNMALERASHSLTELLFSMQAGCVPGTAEFLLLDWDETIYPILMTSLAIIFRFTFFTMSRCKYVGIHKNIIKL